MLSLSQIEQVIINRTSKGIISCEPVILNNLDLAGITYTGENEVYVGKLQGIFDNVVTCYLKVGTDITMLNIGGALSKDYYRSYDNVMLTRFQQSDISEDTEIMFSGYKFTLDTP